MKKKINLIIFGAGGHSKSCIDVIDSTNKFRIRNLVDPKRKNIFKYTSISEKEFFKKKKYPTKNIFIAFGNIYNLNKKKDFYNYLKKKGFKFPRIVSNKAYISKHSKVSDGSIIMHHAVINADVKVGENCIINTSAIIEHGTNINNHCQISPGTIINGGCDVGEGTFIGSGCVIKEGIKIGKNCFIGMNKSLTKNLPDNSKFK